MLKIFIDISLRYKSFALKYYLTFLAAHIHTKLAVICYLQSQNFLQLLEGMKLVVESLGMLVWLQTGHLLYTVYFNSPDFILHGSQFELEIRLTQDFLKLQMNFKNCSTSIKLFHYRLENLVVGQNPQDSAAVEEKIIVSCHRDGQVQND